MWRVPAALLPVLFVALVGIAPTTAAPPCGRGNHVCPTPTATVWPTADPAMAFPTVSDADTKNGTVTTNATSWTLTYPTNIAVNDLLLAFVATDGTQASAGTWPAGWITERVNSAASCLIIAKKKATGSETGTFTVTLPSSEQGGWRVFRITAATWGGTLGADWGVSQDVQRQFSNAGTDANPDPPTVTWNGGGGGAAADVLWFAVAAVDTSRTFSVFPQTPSVFTNTSSDVSGGAGGASLGLARLASNAANVDPGAFTISAADDWVAGSIAVSPLAVATFSPPFRSKSIHNALVR